MSPQTIQARQRCSAATSALRSQPIFRTGNMPVGADNHENALRLCFFAPLRSRLFYISSVFAVLFVRRFVYNRWLS
jgi:hypothetical protein